jgi:hypothetical protein
LASKNKTTITTRTQDTITQRDLELLAIAQYQLAGWIATCERLEGRIAKKRGTNGVVEPGRFSLADTSVEMRP